MGDIAILNAQGLPMRDGLANALSGHGTSVDRRTFAHYNQTYINPVEIFASYRTSWLMRRVIDLPAGDMTREWRDWQADKELIGKIEAAEKALGLRAKVQKALALGRLGGGAMILGVDQGTADRPLNPEMIRPNSLRYIHVVSRFALTLGAMDLDLESPTFGEPLYFELSSARSQARIHPSRVITFKGLPVPEWSGIAVEQSYWGDPVFQAIRDALVNADMAQTGFASLIDEAQVVSWGIPDFFNNMIGTPGYDKQIRDTIGTIEQAKSMHRARIHDAAMKVETRQVAWTGMPDIIQTYLGIVAGAADIPATRLLGKAPDGMNSTGEHDERNYLSSITSRQETELRPQLDRLDAIIMNSASIDLQDAWYEFAPLSSLTEAEAAEVAFKKAQAVKIYIDAGMNIDAVLRGAENMLLEDGFLPGFDEALDEFGTELPSGDPAMPDPAALQATSLAKPVESGAAPAKGIVAPAPTARAANDVRFTDATPRSLYVQRKLLNAADVIKWAKAQGFDTTTPPDEMHVTIAFSRTAIDWMKVGSDWSSDRDGNLVVAAGGPRIVEPLGDKGAVVLLFQSNDLKYRHDAVREAGASFDFDEYQPHVTITYSAPAGLDLSSVAPYVGPLKFGPELFSEVVDDWEQTVSEE